MKSSHTSPFGTTKDLFYMKQALKYAGKAYENDEVPVGAIIVNAQGKRIGIGYNQVMKKRTQLAHAELQAIKQAGKKQADWRLEGCWMYVTLEPCSMCINAIVMSRIEGIVIGASSPLFGYTQWMQLDNEGPLSLYRMDTLKIVGGVSEEMSSHLLKKFFQQKRKKSCG